ncbi:AI-2E family transporter [Methanogenium organophilum]|uniref:AI-2E family transporter n=1 Tax=Methanogenium organophilum TaxID=2199 RepID=A0A9X9S3K2_METOG|nr:AI-2E family transporter [Methanogenium organophilum]WAI01112.1 AI-2E family transporter [Methanogenium organophilum]
MKSAFADHDKLALLIIGIVLILTLYAFGSLLGIVILAISLAIVVMPLKTWLSRYVREQVAAFAVTFIVGFIVVGSLLFGVVILYENADYLTQIITDIYIAIMSMQQITTPGVASTPPIDVGEILDSQMEMIQSGFFSVVSGFTEAIFNAIIFFLTLFIFIFFGENIWKGILSGVPASMNTFVSHIEEISSNTLYSIYIVHISTSVITFLLAIPFFYVLGYGHILFWSLIVALFQLIPIIGPTLIMIFLGIYALATGDYRAAALIAIIGYPVVCAVPDLLFRPIMMGKRTSIHPAIMWVGFFGGLWIMGIVGFVIGPLVLALLVASGRELIRIMKQAKENGWLEKPPV